MTNSGPSSSPERRTVSEDVYRAVKRDILGLRHRPGTPLKEQELAERYGTSRVPIREACLRLQQEGLIESVPYRGYTVSRISLKNITDSFDLRLLLETRALDLACEGATDDGLRRLERLAGSEYSHEDWDSHVVFLERNREFHLALAHLSGNDLLAKMLGDLLESMQRYFFLGLDLGDYGPEMREEHQHLTALLRAGDRHGARRCLEKQIDWSRRRIIERLLQHGADISIE